MTEEVGEEERSPELLKGELAPEDKVSRGELDMLGERFGEEPLAEAGIGKKEFVLR